MFASIVPLKSQLSCSTIPNSARTSLRRICWVSTPSIKIVPTFEFVEAHKQIDDRRLAGASRSDDRHRLTGRIDAKSHDDRLIRLVAEGRHGRRRRRLRPFRVLAGWAGSATSSSSSRNSKTRSAAAAVDCRTLATIGCLGDRLGELVHVLDEGLDIADVDLALHAPANRRGPRRRHSRGCRQTS